MALKFKNKKSTSKKTAKKTNKKTKREMEEDDIEEEDIEEEEDQDDDSESEDEEDVEDEDEEEEEEPRRKKKSSKKGAKSKKTSTKSKKKSTKAKSGKKKKKRASFLKTGKDKVAAFEQDEMRAKRQEAEYGKLWRFYISLKSDIEDYVITFLDGDLDEDGAIENPVFFEHNVKIGGNWTQFVSCQEDEPDPLQESGKEPYLAQAFTVVDRTEYEDDDGNVYPPKKKLFVAKRKTMKQLQKIAAKRGGLAGCTFTISRTGKNAPNVGDHFDFEEKISLKELKKELKAEGVDKEDLDDIIVPADYEEELTYYTADELLRMGLVEDQGTISQRDADDDADDDADEDDVDDDF